MGNFVDVQNINVLPCTLGDVKNRWKRSALKNSNNKNDENRHLENLIYDVLQDHGEMSESAEQYVLDAVGDNISQDSYGSHINRNFDAGSHRGSFKKKSFNDVMNEDQHGRLSMILMNSGANLIRKRSSQPKLHHEGFEVDVSLGMYHTDDFSASPKEKRSVVIDDKEIDMFSPDEENVEGDDEENAQARLEAEILEATTQELLMKEYPSDCCPETCYLRFPILAGGDPDSPFWQGWGNLRIKTFRLIENKYFETAVIAMILISSLALVS